jgi:hypothetical protein
MSKSSFDPKHAATDALNRYDVAVIRQLRQAADQAYSTGNVPAARLIAEFADTAERVSLQRRKTSRGSP